MAEVAQNNHHHHQHHDGHHDHHNDQHPHHHFNMFSFFGPREATSPQIETPQLATEKGAMMTAVSEDRVDVLVGHPGKARTWKVHKDLLAQFSTYFGAAFESGTDEARDAKFALPDQDPAVFALFVQWLYSPNKDIIVGGPEAELASTDPWVATAHKAYELGQHLQSPAFSRFALVRFMQGIRFANAATLLSIYHDGDHGRIPESDPLRKFTASWLWYVRQTHALLWSVSSWWIGEGDLADPVCGPLVRKMLKDKAAFGELGDSHSGLLDRALDPHWLNLDHWFQPCSANPLPHNCSHVPFPCNQNIWGQKQY